ncbi:hypothetical protein [Sphaerisporangium corydalis]|uniref:DNA recombination protein RmuC n=1 Tax=Sphaerisporangium corydalis TaxID=1441875 RepID=A0ABV9EPV6_9ACTN|nr:hypothetical protein [Sphaerisporangium corydalis]
MKEILIPLGVFLFLTLVIVAALVTYFRLLQHRTGVAEMAAYRELAERTLRQQEQVQAQLTELTARVAGVEQILRSVG